MSKFTNARANWKRGKAQDGDDANAAFSRGSTRGSGRGRGRGRGYSYSQTPVPMTSAVSDAQKRATRQLLLTKYRVKMSGDSDGTNESQASLPPSSQDFHTAPSTSIAEPQPAPPPSAASASASSPSAPPTVDTASALTFVQKAGQSRKQALLEYVQKKNAAFVANHDANLASTIGSTAPVNKQNVFVQAAGSYPSKFGREPSVLRPAVPSSLTGSTKRTGAITTINEEDEEEEDEGEGEEKKKRESEILFLPGAEEAPNYSFTSETHSLTLLKSKPYFSMAEALAQMTGGERMLWKKVVEMTPEFLCSVWTFAQKSPLWLWVRKLRVTGSVGGYICGWAPYKDSYPARLAFKQCYTTSNPAAAKNEYMDYGNRHEDQAAQFYVNSMQLRIICAYRTQREHGFAPRPGAPPDSKERVFYFRDKAFPVKDASKDPEIELRLFGSQPDPYFHHRAFSADGILYINDVVAAIAEFKCPVPKERKRFGRPAVTFEPYPNIKPYYWPQPQLNLYGARRYWDVSSCDFLVWTPTLVTAETHVLDIEWFGTQYAPRETLWYFDHYLRLMTYRMFWLAKKKLAALGIKEPVKPARRNGEPKSKQEKDWDVLLARMVLQCIKEELGRPDMADPSVAKRPV